MAVDAAVAEPTVPGARSRAREEGEFGRQLWPVGRIIRRAILQCPADTPVAQAARLMAEQGCSSIIVTEAGAAAGIWTERDALALDFSDADALARPIAEVMSTPIRTLREDVTIEEAMPRFRESGLRHFLVVDAYNKPVGVLSRTDMVRNSGLHGYLTLRTVASVTGRRPLEIAADASVAAAARALRHTEAEAALVVEADGTAFGIVTERDILRLVARRDIGRPVRAVASSPVVAVPAGAPLLTAQELMETLHIRHLGVEDGDGRIAAILSFTDILHGIESDYLQHLQAALSRQLAILQAGERRQETILNLTQEGYAEVDHDGRITTCNAAFAALLGMSQEELTGRALRSLAHGDAATRLDEGFRAAIAAGDTPHAAFETDLLRQNGTSVPVRVAATVLHDEDEAVIGAFAFFSDLTQLRQGEQRQRELLNQLSQSNAELEAFAYIISHDLQEPLRMIASYLQLVDRRTAGTLDGETREFVGYAVDGAKRMQSMITDLLDYSRIDRKGRPFEPCDTGQAADSALRRLEVAMADSGGRVTRGPLPVIDGDFQQLVRLFQHLIDNALKYRAPDRPPRIHISAEADPEQPDRWRFAVQDNGIGIEPQFNDRIFLMFQRLHARGAYSGNGIGLAICKRIVERHKGRIWVESHPGSGSTFLFTLPAAAAAAPAAARTETTA
ncbi:CBS domain-containing protein [Caenispirillum bisanense]|uniref:CBS domain-containing protein n=1 Tax=Caenispirillum bisanense TaxID=414052 RepID=UPI0031E1F892